MNQNKFINMFFLAICCSVLGLVSCESSSSLDDSTTVQEIKTNLSASIAITSSDAAKISMGSSSSMSLKMTTPPPLTFPKELLKSTDGYLTLTTGTCYLNKVQKDGSTTYTGKSSPVNTDGTCSFDDVTVNQTYVIEVEAIGQDAQGKTNILRQSAIAMPTDDDLTPEINVSDTTSIIVTTLISNALETITNLDDLDKTTVNTVVTVIVSALNSAIDSGYISITSSVETYTGQDKTRLEDVEIEFDEDDKLNSEWLSNNDKNLSHTLQQFDYMSDLKDDDMTQEEAEDFIRKIFGVTQSSQQTESDRSYDKGVDVPEFIISEFAKSYLDNKNASLLDMSKAYLKATSLSSFIDSTSLATNMLSVVEGKLAELESFYSAATSNYALIDDFDDISAVQAVFTETRLNELTSFSINTLLTVPEVILAFSALELMEGRLNLDLVDQATLTQIASIAGANFNAMDSFDPIVFSTEIGFLDLSQMDAAVDIEHAEIRSMKQWFYNSNTQVYEEITVLVASVDIVGFGTTNTIDRVVLDYPKTNGVRGSIELVKFSDFNSRQKRNEQSKQGVKAHINSKDQHNFRKKSMSSEYGTDFFFDHYMIDPWRNANHKISDFVDGKAMIKIFDQSNAVIASFEKMLFSFELSPESIGFIFPKGEDMNKISQFGWDSNFEETVVPLNGDTSTQIEISWKGLTQADKEKIPTSHQLVYVIDLGYHIHSNDYSSAIQNPPSVASLLAGIDSEFEESHNDEWDYEDSFNSASKWKHIWSSWDLYNPFIKSTSFMLPVKLISTLSQDNWTAEYELDIRPILINSNKDIVWEGQGFRTHFKVGDVQPWQVPISGQLKFPPDAYEKLSSHLSYLNYNGSWKIGIFQMDGFDSNTNQWVNYFWDQDSNSTREPIQPFIQDLGDLSSAQIDSDGYRLIDFTFPSINQTQDILKKKSWYELIVWYDNPTKNVSGIDVETKSYNWGSFINFVEEFQSCGGLHLENLGLIYDSFGKDYERIVLTESSSSINCEPYYFLDESYYDYWDDYSSTSNRVHKHQFKETIHNTFKQESSY